ncbi:MAG: phosphate ABC transporter substrate-binding protein [Methanobacterium sp.]|nr:phosphate ABC transporter substrate-binding protein [Methanobacterium sp.]
MNWKYITGIIILIIIIIAYIMVTSQNNYVRVEVAGSTSVQPVASQLADAYMKKHPDVKINVQGGGSGLGIRSVSQGIIDIGTSSKGLNANESTGLKQYLIGKDGVLVVINNNSQLDGLNKTQIKDIYSGKITNWKDVGGPDATINVITREDGSGTRSVFQKIVMGKDKIKGDAVVLTSTESIAQSVKGDPNAIGYMSLTGFKGDIKALKVDGVYPSEETIFNGTYPIQNPFLFLTKGEPQGVVKDFIDFCLSPEGQEIVKEEKVVPAS